MNRSADFFPFVNGEARLDLNCKDCTHFREESDCAKWTETQGQGDDKCYPFCGPICGYFTPEQGGANGA
jgi:hypothetical protein